LIATCHRLSETPLRRAASVAALMDRLDQVYER
jgi:hypothetical protein